MRRRLWHDGGGSSLLMNCNRIAAALLSASLLLSSATSGAASGAVAGTAGRGPGNPPAKFRPKLAVPEVLAPFLKYVEPGSDEFVEEREAAEIAARLGELGERLKAEPGRAAQVADWLLAPGFRGGRLTAAPEAESVRGGSLEVRRAKALSRSWCSTRARSPRSSAACSKTCARRASPSS